MGLRAQITAWAGFFVALASLEGAALVLSRQPPFSGVLPLEAMSVAAIAAGLFAAVVVRGDLRVRVAAGALIVAWSAFKLWVLIEFFTNVD